MISNDRSASGYSQFGNSGPRPPTNEDTLKTEKIQIERKTFVFSLKENPRGRFLRITEDEVRLGVDREEIVPKERETGTR